MTARTTIADAPNELQTALASDGAFEAWYRRTLPRIYSYLLSRCGHDSGLAEELTQQTFIAAVAQRSRYDGRSDTVTWLCGIARHKLADHFRVIERDERRRMRRAAIADAIRSLPASQQAVLTFVVLDDLSVAEAARIMGKSQAATQSLLHRARDGFRRAFDPEATDD